MHPICKYRTSAIWDLRDTSQSYDPGSTTNVVRVGYKIQVRPICLPGKHGGNPETPNLFNDEQEPERYRIRAQLVCQDENKTIATFRAQNVFDWETDRNWNYKHGWQGQVADKDGEVIEFEVDGTKFPNGGALVCRLKGVHKENYKPCEDPAGCPCGDEPNCSIHESQSWWKFTGGVFPRSRFTLFPVTAAALRSSNPLPPLTVKPGPSSIRAASGALGFARFTLTNNTDDEEIRLTGFHVKQTNCTVIGSHYLGSNAGEPGDGVAYDPGWVTLDPPKVPQPKITADLAALSQDEDALALVPSIAEVDDFDPLLNFGTGPDDHCGAVGCVLATVTKEDTATLVVHATFDNVRGWSEEDPLSCPDSGDNPFEQTVQSVAVDGVILQPRESQSIYVAGVSNPHCLDCSCHMAELIVEGGCRLPATGGDPSLEGVPVCDADATEKIGELVMPFSTMTVFKNSPDNDVFDAKQCTDGSGIAQGNPNLVGCASGCPELRQKAASMFDISATDGSTDADADGLDDRQELNETFTKIDTADTDGDGLEDGDEVTRGTDPNRADTDGDGLSDGEEITALTDPLDRDPDRDGLDDPREILLGTDPHKADTDDDGMVDGLEDRNGLDPLIADAADPQYDDTDGDGLSDNEEQTGMVITDPALADSDGDGLDDGQEVAIYRCQPDAADTDQDGLNDVVEAFTTFSDTKDADSDDDELSDGDEVNTYGSAPNRVDTDRDGVDDAAEVLQHGCDPANRDTDDGGAEDLFETTLKLDCSDAADDVLGTEPVGGLIVESVQPELASAGDHPVIYKAVATLDEVPIVGQRLIEANQTSREGRLVDVFVLREGAISPGVTVTGTIILLLDVLNPDSPYAIGEVTFGHDAALPTDSVFYSHAGMGTIELNTSPNTVFDLSYRLSGFAVNRNTGDHARVQIEDVQYTVEDDIVRVDFELTAPDFEPKLLLLTQDLRAFEIASGEQNCADDTDNDNDGLSDCADPDCENHPACFPEESPVDDDVVPLDPSGCGCGLASNQPTTSVLWLIGALVSLGMRRRRRSNDPLIDR